MMEFTLYDPATGEVAQTGSCPDEAFELQARDGLELIEGTYPSDRFFHDGQGMVEFPPQPSPVHVWDFGQSQWVDPRTLDDLKALRWEEMKVLRQQAIEAPLLTAYGVFDADPLSRQNIVNTAQLVQTAAQSLAPGEQPTVEFTLADNTVATLTASQMVEVALTLASQVQGAYARGRQVRVAIAAATTREELDAVQWAA